MNKKMQTIILLLILLLLYILKLKIIVLLILISIFLTNLFNFIKVKYAKKNTKNIELEDFHKYLKRVILYTYTRPIKQSFIDANKSNGIKLQEKINLFLDEMKYDFSIKPYQNLAYKLNPTKKGINYELNIMYMLYEVDKKGLGNNYINDLLKEIDLIMDNTINQKIEDIKESGYKYSLPPLIINFVYISLILFEVIDNMIMNVLV